MTILKHEAKTEIWQTEGKNAFSLLFSLSLSSLYSSSCVVYVGFCVFVLFDRKCAHSFTQIINSREARRALLFFFILFYLVEFEHTSTSTYYEWKWCKNVLRANQKKINQQKKQWVREGFNQFGIKWSERVRMAEKKVQRWRELQIIRCICGIHRIVHRIAFNRHITNLCLPWKIRVRERWQEDCETSFTKMLFWTNLIFFSI